MTEKAKIVEQVKQSFAHLQKAVLSLSDADDRNTTNLACLLLIARHLGEHLGQTDRLCADQRAHAALDRRSPALHAVM